MANAKDYFLVENDPDVKLAFWHKEILSGKHVAINLLYSETVKARIPPKAINREPSPFAKPKTPVGSDAALGQAALDSET